jgi:FtsP/CotA-like multicopper oxidase with cupredoxin domain/peroxiredoxin
MTNPTRPPALGTAAEISSVRLLAAALFLVMAALAPAAEKVQPAPSLRQAQARFAARNVDRRPVEAEATRSIRPQVVALDDEAICKVTQGDPQWVDPTTVRPPDNGSPITLRVDFATSTVGPVNVNHRSYNKAPVGPVIRVRQGQTLVVELDNGLPAEPAAPVPAPGSAGPGHAEVPHGFNTTNLHTHGLHVSPRGNADNVFLELVPGENKTLVFPIRADHPAGTFWYHSHKHGSVALQLSSGMAGALIVEGGIDNYPAFQSQHITEKVMVFQQMVYHKPNDPTKPAEVLPENIYSTMKPVKPKVAVTLINGQYVPVITMRPGEVQRWRMVHAGIQTAIYVHLEGHTQSEIALDGLPLRAIRRVQYAELQPAYRSDVLIQASDTPGVYCLYNSVEDAAMAFKNMAVPPEILAKVVVAGDPAKQSLPDAGDWTMWVNDLYDKSMPDLRDIADAEIQGTPRSIVFSHTNLQDFTLNGQVFDPTRIDQRITLGTAEKWMLAVKPNGDNHPFHIHVNPFQVQVPYPEEGSPRLVWRDTLLVTPKTPAEIRSRFIHFPGKTVLHCHNLDHEDHGMMQAICLLDPKVPDPACPAAAPVPAKTTASTAAGGPAPAWRLRNAAGRDVASADYRGRRLLLVFHRGFECWHCAEQVVLLDRSAGSFRDLGVDVLVVSPGAEATEPSSALTAGPGALQLLRDPTLSAFRDFGCLAGGQILHGAFLIDGEGRVGWGRVGERPETDIRLILEQARKLAGSPRGPAVPVATK